MSYRRLVINGKFLGAKPTGVHRVADQLVRELALRSAELSEIFKQPPVIVAPNNVRKRSSFPIETCGLFRGQLWEQIDLPLRTKSDFLINLCNLGPVNSRFAITMIHDAQVFITPDSYSWAFTKWYRSVLPALGRRHLRILTVSKFSAEQLARFGVAQRDRISVIPNGVDHLLGVEPEPEIIQRHGLEPRKFVFALANVQTHKNIGLLLKAFSDPALSDLKLALVGAADRKQFEAIGHSIPQNVIFAERVNEHELRALFESALCVAFPSTTEGFGLPPLEGMSLGCPAIMAPCGALPEMGGDAVLYASPNDPGQWLNAIAHLAREHELWQRYSSAGLQRAKLFTWKRAGEELLEIIRSVVVSSRAPQMSCDAKE